MKTYINKELLKIVISIFLIVLSIIETNNNIQIIYIALSYVIISYDIYCKALNNLKKKDIFNENFLMIIATLGAFYIGSNLEAVMVMLLFEIGEYFAHLAIHKSRKSITELMDLKVEKVNIIQDDTRKSIKIENVKINDIFIVKPGEKIPLDGIVIEGNSFIDTSSLTGETVPIRAMKDDKVLSGTINKDSVLKIKATSTYETTTTTRILKLIEESNDKKSNTENFIHRFAKIYTPIIVFFSLSLVLIPTLLGGDFKEWLYRALVFLVTSCPCALVISVPLGYFCGIGKASTVGALIKGAKELENLSNNDYLFLDKTGTITEGVFKVTKVKSKNLSEKEFIKLVASAEVNSIHPIAVAIKEYNTEKLTQINNYTEIPGMGISCKIKNKDILIGNKKLLEENNIKVDKNNEVETTIYVSIDNKYEGYIVISDHIKESSYNIKDLTNAINKKIIVLSGDNNDIVEKVSKEVGINTYYGNLLPEDKVKHVKDYNKKGKTIFVGDGINDAPVIKIANVGVSMGGIGSDAAIEASDIVIMNDNLDTLRKAINISRLTKIKVSQNIALALIVKFLVLVLGAIGMSTIWMAVVADVGVTFIAIINVLTILLEKID